MIFVTVGTHEQQFDRLVKEIDHLKGIGFIKEDVFIQLGYCEYIPLNCKYEKLIEYDEMHEKSKEARIIITHGGPGSIMLAIQYNKVPIVVPRQHEFNEHVDNHQVLFTKKMEEKNKIIGVYDITNLKKILLEYEQIIDDRVIDMSFEQNRSNFIEKLENYVTSIS